MKKSDSSGGPNPSELITNQIANSGLARQAVRPAAKTVLDAAPGSREWKGTAVWTHKGLSAAPGYSDHVKLNFFKGGSE
jgi:hypothetical protein